MAAAKLEVVLGEAVRLRAVAALPDQESCPGFTWLPMNAHYTATLSLMPSFGACTKSCLVPRYRSVVWTDAWPSSNWICSSSPPAARHIFAHERRRSWGAIPGTPATAAYGWSNCQTTFSLRQTPCAWPARFTGRNTNPSATPAAAVHASVATFTHVGTGIVRTRPCFPTRSTMHHRPSRCWTWPTVRAGHLGSSQAAAQEDRQDRAVPKALGRGSIRGV